MEDNIPGFSHSSTLHDGPHRVVFIPQGDMKPSSRVRSVTTRRRWHSFSEVLFDNERFLARRPPLQIQTTPPPAPSPPSRPRKTKRRRTRGSKDWSMVGSLTLATLRRSPISVSQNTIWSQENLDEDILTYVDNTPPTTNTQASAVGNSESGIGGHAQNLVCEGKSSARGA
ncbi:hypothetical protein BDN72DRAFT_169500 [Pluteus cervinus]|uniref:Uncharacterized protein n=1 Tax=Pluteus cervinus TaxID=181527 RepID=A0ACD3B6C3_9AGAR|nr:hypothetical protein BDN72DRAFT_169500 [Pluteus cervinus]